jgi:dTDP-4-dehydrorhamnose reductase
MSKIAILGSTGMLGSALTKYLSNSNNQVLEFNRSGNPVETGNSAKVLDISNEQSIEEFLNHDELDYVINGIGLIKQLINDDSEADVELAYKVNSDFPSMLNEFSIQSSTPVIQIGTDCVYSGTKGAYNEMSEFDCTDIYGLSKVAGENSSKSLMTIRCSIIGHEFLSKVSLMDWFLSQPLNAFVRGFTNHHWNGVTTLDFAKIVQGVISSGNFISGTTHLIPANQLSKYELLRSVAQNFSRLDISIEPVEASTTVNRTLSTIYPDRNSDLWTNAGYTQPPTVQEMVQNYALWSE